MVNGPKWASWKAEEMTNDDKQFIDTIIITEG